MVLISPNHSSQRNSLLSDIAVIGDDMYSVMSDTETLGYVYRVGNVFVALQGGDFGRAVEVGQTLSWDRAIDIVRAA